MHFRFCVPAFGMIGLYLLLGAGYQTLAQPASDENAMLGRWVSRDSSVIIRIYPCSEGRYCGCICWARKWVPHGRLMENRYGRFAFRPRLTQLVVLWDLKYDKQMRWNTGKLYDHRRDSVYRARLVLNELGQLEIRRYPGLVLWGKGRAEIWTRFPPALEEPAAPADSLVENPKPKQRP